MNCKIEHMSSISSIYYALLQTGYDYYSLERDPGFSSLIESYIVSNEVLPFFTETKQSTCKEYSFWPRAFILEAATFYLDEKLNGFSDFDSFQSRIMSAENIAAEEKDNRLWTWITGFPEALKQVINSSAFIQYLKWEAEWISGQNSKYHNELRRLDNLLIDCQENYNTVCHNIKIVLCPIKCVYASDYHIFDDSFIFTSGDMRIDSIIHEYLHTIVHPMIEHGIVTPEHKQSPGIDRSYYLDKSEKGYINAFEEFAVRTLTNIAMTSEELPDLRSFLEQLAE